MYHRTIKVYIFSHSANATLLNATLATELRYLYLERERGLQVDGCIKETQYTSLPDNVSGVTIYNYLD